MFKFIKSIFGSKHERDVKDLYPIVDLIKTHEESLKSLNDEELRSKTDEFRGRIHDHIKD
jgi:preprotein translocase subunit SecA